MHSLSQLNANALMSIAIALAAIGLIAAVKIRDWRRWLAVCPPLSLSALLLVSAIRIREQTALDLQRSKEIFLAFDTSPAFTELDRKAADVLSRSPQRVREEVIRLAFANSTNALRALPRLSFFLQAAVQLDPDRETRRHLWTNVVQPALRGNLRREIIWLAAATAALGDYRITEATPILQLLTPLIASETNADSRSIGLGIFARLAEHSTRDQAEVAANLLLMELRSEDNPMQMEEKAFRLDLDGSRRVRDLRNITRQLTGDPARRFADKLISALGAETNASRALALAKVLADLRAELSPTQVQRGASNMIANLSARRGTVMQGRAEPLTSLVAVATPAVAAQVVESIIELLPNEPNEWWNGEITKPFASAIPRLNDADLRRLAERIASISPDSISLIRDRIPREQANEWVHRALTNAFTIGNPTTRGFQLRHATEMASRLNEADADRLLAELWSDLFRAFDEQVQSHLASCIVSITPSLSDQQARWLGREIVVELCDRKTLPAHIATTLLTPLFGRVDHALMTRVLDFNMKRYEKPVPFIFNSPAEPVEFMTKAGATPEQFSRIAAPLVDAFENFQDTDAYMAPLGPLTSLADRLTPSQMDRVATRVTALYAKKGTVFSFGALNRISPRLKFTPQQIRSVYEPILSRALGCNLAGDEILNQSAEVFLKLLPAEDVEKVGDQIITVMGRARTPQMCAVHCARLLMSLTNVVTAEQAKTLAAELLHIPERHANQPGLESVLDTKGWGPTSDLEGRSIRIAAPGLKVYDTTTSTPAFSDWALPWVFVERHENRFYNHRLEAWARSIAAFLAKTNPDERQGIADQVARLCAEQAKIEPIVFDKYVAEILQYASIESLEAIFEAPLAVGSLRRMALHAWEQKTHRSND